VRMRRVRTEYENTVGGGGAGENLESKGDLETSLEGGGEERKGGNAKKGTQRTPINGEQKQERAHKEGNMKGTKIEKEGEGSPSIMRPRDGTIQEVKRGGYQKNKEPLRL